MTALPEYWRCVLFYYFRYTYLARNPSRCDLGGPKFQHFPGGHAPDPPKRACFARYSTFHILHSTVYVALPLPEQLLYSGYATGTTTAVFSSVRTSACSGMRTAALVL